MAEILLEPNATAYPLVVKLLAGDTALCKGPRFTAACV